MLFSIRSVFSAGLWFFTTRLFKFRQMSVTSSKTPGIVLNSCWTPCSFTLLTALPSSEESRIRRRLLPIVCPNPRSNGSTWNAQ